MSDVNVGERVVDQDDEDPNIAVVINTPNVPADEWQVGGTVVADYYGNEKYDDSERVTIVVFEETLREHRPEYAGSRPIPLAELASDGVPFFAFPTSRLKHVDEGPRKVEAVHTEESSDDGSEDDDTGDEDTDEGLDEIADGLRELNLDHVEVDGDVVRVEKLGETFTVTRDGSVDGKGLIADRLEAAASEVSR